MNEKIMKRMLLGALLALALQCQVAVAACSAVPLYQESRGASRCLPA